MKKQVVRRAKVDDSHLPKHLHPVIRQLYASRQVNSAQQLDLTLKNLLRFDAMVGLDQACQVIYQAMSRGKQITIIGDFDADGATSTALMMQAFTLHGYQNHRFLVPNRFEYGYGLSAEIAEIAVKQGAQLIITVDNGISCHQGVAKAKALGCQVIVTDHHLPGETLPDADGIVNPNQRACQFPSKAIAGVGVAFYLMLALRRYLSDKNWYQQQGIEAPNLGQLLDLVALGTVADVVALDANNRILVAQGLMRIRAGQTRPGIQALIEVAGRNQAQLVASDFGFALGPRINAAGRLDDMTYGIQCLLAQDITTARGMAAELDALNKERRTIEQGMQLEAESVMKKLNFSAEKLPHALALYQHDWHQGVIGIVAGRLKEKFNRPAIVFAPATDSAPEQNVEIKGSARSIEGLHIRDLLEHIDSQHPGIILKFGGHAMAAGVSIAAGSFDNFQHLFNRYAQEWLSEEQLQSRLLSDGELSDEELTLPFAFKLREAGPWGQQFPEPLFDDVFTLVQQRLVGEKHLKMVVQKGNKLFDAIAFNVDVRAWPNSQAQQVHLVYQLDVNEFRNKQSLQLLVNYIDLAEPAALKKSAF
jgi:single-stranded-DNA-specific exonuclease